MIYDRYYYSKLPDDQKQLYKAIYDGLHEMKPKITWTGKTITQDVFSNVLNAINMDNPHLFYVDFADIVAQQYFSRQDVIPAYCYTKDEKEIVFGKVKKVLQKILSKVCGKNDFQKALCLHDLLVKNVLYDKQAVQNLNRYHRRSNTILGVLFFKTAVCEGIAKIFKYLLNALDIKCIVVVGKASDTSLPDCDILHAWNVAKLDGKAVHIDVTWDVNASDEQSVSHDYFALTDKAMAIDHEVKTFYPPCNHDDMDYFVVSNLLVKNKQDVTKIVANTLKRGDTAIEIKYDSNVFDEPQQVYDLFTNQLLLQTKAQTITTTCQINQPHNVIKITW